MADGARCIPAGGAPDDPRGESDGLAIRGGWNGDTVGEPAGCRGCALLDAPGFGTRTVAGACDR
jgi:hypothetical protein